MWFIWKIDEHRLNITPLKGCFRSFVLLDKCLWFTVITNELNSFTMQNFQLIVLSVWEPTDKISHLHDCTFHEEIKKHFE